jgi:hypothetical protein
VFRGTGLFLWPVMIRASDWLPWILIIVLTFSVSLGAAFVVTFVLARIQRASRSNPALGPLALGLAGGLAIGCGLAALDLVGWGAVSAGGGIAIGVLAGEALGVTPARSHG